MSSKRRGTRRRRTLAIGEHLRAIPREMVPPTYRQPDQTRPDGYLEYCNDKQCCPTREQTIALQKNLVNHGRAIKRRLTQLTKISEASELNFQTQKKRRIMETNAPTNISQEEPSQEQEVVRIFH